MASAATAREGPSYSSSRVQRAARLNNVEATRLLQQLQYLDKAKQHQTRLTNQDIRLVSMSIDYIQAHSGNSQEAWRPPTSPTDVTDDATNAKPEGPCFMYGERIISRKIRRLARPMSAVERSYGKSLDDDYNSISTYDEGLDSNNDNSHSSNNNKNNNNNNINTIPRPKSCCNSSSKRRPSSAMSWLKLNSTTTSGDHVVDSHDNNKNNNDYKTDSILNSARSGYTTAASGSASPSDFDREREPWEDDTSVITKKILKSQAQSGKRNSVYQPAGAVLTSQSSKKVRDLARKIRINSTQISFDEVDPRLTRQSSRTVLEDKPPKRPSTASDFLGRRATFGEIMNQQKPTLSAGAWRQHLGKNSHVTPLSVTAHQKAMLEAKKILNDTRRADVAEKVKDFVTSR